MEETTKYEGVNATQTVPCYKRPRNIVLAVALGLLTILSIIIAARVYWSTQCEGSAWMSLSDTIPLSVLSTASQISFQNGNKTYAWFFDGTVMDVHSQQIEFMNSGEVVMTAVYQTASLHCPTGSAIVGSVLVSTTSGASSAAPSSNSKVCFTAQHA